MSISMGLKFSWSMILYLRQAKHELDLKHSQLPIDLRIRATILFPKVEYLWFLFFLFFDVLSFRLYVEISLGFADFFISSRLVQCSSSFLLLLYRYLSLGHLSRLMFHNKSTSRFILWLLLRYLLLKQKRLCLTTGFRSGFTPLFLSGTAAHLNNPSRNQNLNWKFI